MGGRMTSRLAELKSFASARVCRLLVAVDDGQTLAEYGLILTVVAVGIVTPAMIVFRTQLIAAFNSAINCMAGAC